MFELYADRAAMLAKSPFDRYTARMFAALMALTGAVVIASAYAVLSGRLDYATVHRRQLDAWAAVLAFVCLTVILYGGVDARRAAIERIGREPAERAPAIPAEIPRIRQPSLYVGEAGDAEEVALFESRAPAPGLPLNLGDEPVTVLASDSGDDRHDEAVDPGAPAARHVAPLDPLPGEPIVPLAPLATAVVRRSVPPGWLLPPTATPAPTAIGARVVPTVAIVVPPTPLPPTPLPPTPEPPVEPSPTPFCGEPGDIRVVVDITQAEADRQARPQEIRYRAEVRSGSDFPINLTNIAATAQDSRSGSDQFGSDRKPFAMQIEPGQSATIEGTIKLERFPSPFGRSELCVSFVADTCGRRSESRPVVRRCVGISGF